MERIGRHANAFLVAATFAMAPCHFAMKCSLSSVNEMTEYYVQRGAVETWLSDLRYERMMSEQGRIAWGCEGKIIGQD